MMIQSYSVNDLNQYFQILKPYLMHSDEMIQRFSVSSLLSLLKQYSLTVAKILKYNQLPLNIYF